MLFDTHAHVNFQAYKDDAEEVIQRALGAGISIVNVGTQIDTSRQAVEMAEKYQEGVYAVVGLHPVHTYSQHLDEEETSFKTREERFDTVLYQSIANNSKVVGIGECGLDYYRLPENDDREKVKQIQKQAFIAQIKLAKELNKALVVHSRSSKGTDDACLDILEILKNELGNMNSELRFVLHSYTGSVSVAKEFVKLGGYISFNGILTFDKTGNQKAVLSVVPNDKILLETDCPYLTPVPTRGKRNEPLFVKYVAEKIANLKNLSVDEVAEITTQNAKALFKL